MAPRLAAVASALGSRIAPLGELEELGLLRTSEAPLAGAGYRFARIAAPDETAVSLAACALGGLPRGGRDAGALLVTSGLSREAAAALDPRDARSRVDVFAACVQEASGLRHASVIGITGQACTGLLGSLRVARGLLAAEPDLQAVACVTADVLPQGVLREQGHALLSDGAGAFLVTRAMGNLELVDIRSVTIGAMAGAGDDHAAAMLLPRVNGLARELLARCDNDRLDAIASPHLHATACALIARSLGVPAHRAVAPDLATAGHAFGADAALALAPHFSEASEPGDRILAYAAGFGLTWQAALFERVAS